METQYVNQVTNDKNNSGENVGSPLYNWKHKMPRFGMIYYVSISYSKLHFSK